MKMLTDAAKEIDKKFCVVVQKDGTAEVKKLKGRNTVFEEARGFIGCECLDFVTLQEYTMGVSLGFLVNDNGYADWNKDPKKVNQVATFFHEGGKAPSRYILGNIVICLAAMGDEGEELIGMSELLSARIKKKIDSVFLSKAKEIVPIPKVVLEPEIKILGFNNCEELYGPKKA